MRNNEPSFVGESRLHIVDSLMETFDEVNKTGTPQWISLEAPSGWGKTRIVREFYSRLAHERQTTQPAYWPLSMLDNQDVDLSDVNVRRKTIFPQVVHAPGSLPNFAWWGITCARRGGVSTQALAADIGQFEAHAPYLEDAWRRLRPKKESVSTGLRGLGVAVGDEIVSEGIGAILDATGAAVPGLGLVQWAAAAGMNQRRARAARKDRLYSSDVIKHDSADLVDETLEKLSKLSRPGLPLIVFIEDFHCADSDTALTELLSKLLSANAAVLLITSALPGHLDTPPNLSQLLGDHTRILTRIQTHNKTLAFSEESSPLLIHELSPDDLGQIVKQYHPLVDARTQSKLVQRYTNPLMLELVCTRPLYRNKFPQGDLNLTSEEINRLPRDLNGLYLQQWNELPEDLRYALNLAAHCIPQLISDTYGLSQRWHLELALELLEELHRYNPHLNKDTVALALSEATVAYSWVRRLTPLLLEFSDYDQRAIAFGEEMLDTSSELLAIFADKVCKKIQDGRFDDSEEEEYTAWAIFALKHAGHEIDMGAFAVAALVLLDSLSVYPRELARRVSIARYTLDHMEDNSSRGREIRLRLATALHEQGQVSDAIVLLEQLVRDWEGACGPNSIETLRAKIHLANVYQSAARLGDAIDLGESILEACENASGASYETFAVLKALAQSYGLAGHITKATYIYEKLLNDQQHMDKLTVWALKSDLAHVTGMSGDIAGALDMTASLLIEQEGGLHPDDPQVLITRNNLYGLSFKAHPRTDVLQLFSSLLEDCKRVLGPYHPVTAKVRNGLASCQGELGHVNDAILVLEDLLEDQKEYLSSTHPDILTTRNNIAVFRLKNGDTEGSIVLFESLLIDQENILGAESPEACATRNELFWLYDRSGQFRDMVRLYRSLYTAQVDRLGAGHPTVEETRNDLSIYLEETGQVAEAIALYESYKTHQENVYGALHPDVIYAGERISAYKKEL